MNNIRPMRPTTMGRPVAHYVAMLVRSTAGEWRVLFPDVPSCEAYGFTVHDATYAATSVLAGQAGKAGSHFPRPRSLGQIAGDQGWFAKQGIAFNEAVVMMVPLWSRWTAL